MFTMFTILAGLAFQHANVQVSTQTQSPAQADGKVISLAGILLINQTIEQIVDLMSALKTKFSSHQSYNDAS